MISAEQPRASSTSRKRSELMKRVRREGTTPEVILRKELHRSGFRFRLNVRRLPGSPDIVLARYRTAIFVHGCFWHGHECRAGQLPKTNREYWSEKIRENRERDQRKSSQLEEAGFRVVVVWTCELPEATARLVSLLETERSREKPAAHRSVPGEPIPR